MRNGAGSEDTLMRIPLNAATAAPTRPATEPAPIETLPADPNDPCGVRREIIEEIEEIGRRHGVPQK